MNEKVYSSRYFLVLDISSIHMVGKQYLTSFLFLGKGSSRTLLDDQKGDASSESICLPSWRRKFTDKQTNNLEEIFLRQKYITGKERAEIAEKLGLTTKQVKTWFQNRRTKWKREKQRNAYQGEVSPQDGLYSFDKNCKGAMEDCVHCREMAKVIPLRNWGCYFMERTYPVMQ